MGQIEVADVTEDFEENETAADDNERAVDWLESNGFCSDEVEVRVTVGRNYSTVEDGKITHRADVDLTIK